MRPEQRDKIWREMMETDEPEQTFTVERERIEEGLTFSEEAMDDLVLLVAIWIGTRVMRRWESTDEPPTVLSVSVSVEVG